MKILMKTGVNILVLIWISAICWSFIPHLEVESQYISFWFQCYAYFNIHYWTILLNIQWNWNFNRHLSNQTSNLPLFTMQLLYESQQNKQSSFKTEITSFTCFKKASRIFFVIMQCKYRVHIERYHVTRKMTPADN